MSTILDLSTEILNEKTEKIIPENIKKGVKIFDIEGALEAGAATEGVKQFTTIEEMNADTTAELGDLAIVYNSSMRGMTIEDQVQKILFPNTVVLDTAATMSGYLIAVDPSSGYFEGNISLTETSFTLYGYGMSSEIDVSYSSEDGITYIRTDGGDETIDFGLLVEFDTEGAKYQKIAPFMQIQESYFGGIFEYKNHESDHLVDFISNVRYEDAIKYDTTSIDVNQFKPILKLIEAQVEDINDMNMWFAGVSIVRTGTDTYTAYGRYTTTDGYSTNANGEKVYPIRPCNILLVKGVPYISTSITATGDIVSPAFYKWDIDLANNTISRTQLNDITENISIGTYSAKYFYLNTSLPNDYAIGDFSIYNDAVTFVNISFGDVDNAAVDNVSMKYTLVSDYLFAPTQLNASSTGVLYNTLFMGANGIEVGTLATSEQYKTSDELKSTIETYFSIENSLQNADSTVTSISSMFWGYNNITSIPNFNTINVTDMSGAFYGCENLSPLPNLDMSNVVTWSSTFYFCNAITTIPNYNTINLTNMYQTFYGCNKLQTIPNIHTSNVINMCTTFGACYQLTDIPQLDTSKVNNMYGTFRYCNNLSNSAIQNIVNMVLNSNITQTNRMNLSNANSYSPLASTKFNSSYYSNRLSELSAAGWSY